jgi:DNA-binding MarR family transcriptional regulator
MVLWEKDRQPVNDIAKRLYLETNTVTPLLKRMEALKIVTRRKDKNDGRVVVVSLTEKGKYLTSHAISLQDRLQEPTRKSQSSALSNTTPSFRNLRKSTLMAKQQPSYSNISKAKRLSKVSEKV